MKKIIQVFMQGDDMYAITEDGNIYKRVYKGMSYKENKLEDWHWSAVEINEV